MNSEFLLQDVEVAVEIIEEPFEMSELHGYWISTRRSSPTLSKREKRRLKFNKKKCDSKKKRENKLLARMVRASDDNQTLSWRARRHLEHEKSKVPATKARMIEAQSKQPSTEFITYECSHIEDVYFSDDDWSHYPSPHMCYSPPRCVINRQSLRLPNVSYASVCR